MIQRKANILANLIITLPYEYILKKTHITQYFKDCVAILKTRNTKQQTDS